MSVSKNEACIKFFTFFMLFKFQKVSMLSEFSIKDLTVLGTGSVAALWTQGTLSSKAKEAQAVQLNWYLTLHLK